MSLRKKVRFDCKVQHINFARKSTCPRNKIKMKKSKCIVLKLEKLDITGYKLPTPCNHDLDDSKGCARLISAEEVLNCSRTRPVGLRYRTKNLRKARSAESCQLGTTLEIKKVVSAKKLKKKGKMKRPAEDFDDKESVEPPRKKYKVHRRVKPSTKGVGLVNKRVVDIIRSMESGNSMVNPADEPTKEAELEESLAVGVESEVSMVDSAPLQCVTALNQGQNENQEKALISRESGLSLVESVPSCQDSSPDEFERATKGLIEAEKEKSQEMTVGVESEVSMVDPAPLQCVTALNQGQNEKPQNQEKALISGESGLSLVESVPSSSRDEFEHATKGLEAEKEKSHVKCQLSNPDEIQYATKLKETIDKITGKSVKTKKKKKKRSVTNVFDWVKLNLLHYRLKDSVIKYPLTKLTPHSQSRCSLNVQTLHMKKNESVQVNSGFVVDQEVRRLNILLIVIANCSDHR